MSQYDKVPQPEESVIIIISFIIVFIVIIKVPQPEESVMCSQVSGKILLLEVLRTPPITRGNKTLR